MKYIITESQFNLLTENKKMVLFQDLINQTLNHIIEGCDKSYDEFPDDISFDACDNAELVNEIKLLSFEFKNNIFILNVNIVFTSIKSYLDFLNLLYNIGDIIYKKFQVKVILKEINQTNTKTDFNS